jgi:hypothetical protein
VLFSWTRVDKIIERGRKRELRMEQADAMVDATMAQIEDTLRTQRFQLRQAFVAALLARDNLQLAGQLQGPVCANRDAHRDAGSGYGSRGGRLVPDPSHQCAILTRGD